MEKKDLECRLNFSQETGELFRSIMGKTGLNLSRVFSEALVMYAFVVQELEQGKEMYISDGKESRKVVGYGGVLGTYRSRTDIEST